MAMRKGVRWYGPQVQRKLRGAAALGVRDTAEIHAQRASAIAPIEEGNLTRDVHVRVDEQALVGVVSFGEGPAAAYVIPQHEDPDYTHDPGREWKFLEKQGKDDPQLLERRVSTRLKEAH